MSIKSNVTAALVIIGNEILSGRTQDKNIQFLATNLGTLGIALMEVRVIPDIHEQIIHTVNSLRPLFTYIFTTGGIGPTHDDITSNAIAEALGLQLHQHPDAITHLKAYYKDSPLNSARLKMTEVPEGATLIENPVSAAPGYHIENIYVLAGVPNIMQAMFEKLTPTLKGGAITHSCECTAYISESKIAVQLSDIQRMFPDVQIGSYPFTTEKNYGTNIVLRSSNQSLLDQAKDEVTKMIRILLSH